MILVRNRYKWIQKIQDVLIQKPSTNAVNMILQTTSYFITTMLEHSPSNLNNQ